MSKGKRAKNQTVAEKLKAKGKEFKVYHIKAKFKNPKNLNGDPFAPHKMMITTIDECPNFKLCFCTWETDPTHWSHTNYGNVNYVGYKGHKISERVGTSVYFSPDMSMPCEEWGEDIPDDVRFFLRDTMLEMITEMKNTNKGWASDTDIKMGFPVSCAQKWIDRVSGVCMSRAKRTAPPRMSKKEMIEEEESGDVTFEE